MLDRNRLYQDAAAFFDLQGSSGNLKLSPAAAQAACREAAGRGWLVLRVEGGLWHSPGFEARLDCIWDGKDPPLAVAAAQENNERAAAFIGREHPPHDVFILTTQALAG